MESFDALRARLAHMVADAPNGADAQRLLSQLTVFHGPFDWEAVIGMRPPEKAPSLDRLMRQADLYRPKEEDQHLLDTLVEWAWLRPHPLNRFVLSDETLRELFPPTYDMHYLHLEYYMRLHGKQVYLLFKKSRDGLITADWSNIMAALQWGFKAPVYLAIEFLEKLAPYLKRHLTPEARQALCQQAYDAAQRLDAKASPAKAFELVGDLAKQDDLDDLVYDSYTQAIMIDKQGRWNRGERGLLEKLRTYATRRGHLTRALTFLEQLRDLAGNWGLASVLSEMGKIHGRLKDFPNARHHFALSLGLRQRDDSSIQTLWAWGQLEYQSGDVQAGCAFCRLAILSIQIQLGRLENSTRPSWRTQDGPSTGQVVETEKWQEWLDRCERDITAMTCGDDV